jgi:hypothetical protein
VECITVAEHFGFCIGNTLKYIWRAGLKGSGVKELEDLKKARWYLDREIARREAALAAARTFTEDCQDERVIDRR